MTDWTWEKVLGKIMAKLTKGISLIENDILYLERISKNR